MARRSSSPIARAGRRTTIFTKSSADGTGLRQLTDGPYDDIEPTYLPNGDIVFVSTRCKRWVNCWLTQVATMHRCDRDGHNVRPISSNNEQDNTPWPLADGRVLYTRWEYVDRSQVDYHHLWTENPDGTSQMVWYGNLQPGTVMIDAKPIPGSEKVVAIFSPGHGQREHAGAICVVDPRAGPDEPASVRRVSRSDELLRSVGVLRRQLSWRPRVRRWWSWTGRVGSRPSSACPRRTRSPACTSMSPGRSYPGPASRSSPTASDPARATGRLVLTNIYQGRNMTGVKPGEITSLLVLESLPMPIHYTGRHGADQLWRHIHAGANRGDGARGTRRLGLHGAAGPAQLLLRGARPEPACRSSECRASSRSSPARPRVAWAATSTARARRRTPTSPCTAMAVHRPASKIEPIAGVPDVIDYPRDIQPVLDALCVGCHGYEPTAGGGPRAGRLILTGDRGPMYSHSYYMLTITRLFSDGRNQPRSNYPPRRSGLVGEPSAHAPRRHSPRRRRPRRTRRRSSASGSIRARLTRAPTPRSAPA